MKAKLKGAETGHSLLKRKSEALTKYATTLKQCALAVAAN
jgi:V-type H+-transporting ATPase subunit D